MVGGIKEEHVEAFQGLANEIHADMEICRHEIEREATKQSSVILCEIENAMRYLREKSNHLLRENLYQKIFFLAEIEYYKKYKKYLLGIKFRVVCYAGDMKSYVPLNKDTTEEMDNPNPCKRSNNTILINEIDSILQKYNLLVFNNENMQRAEKI